jgi:YfiH family protein
LTDSCLLTIPAIDGIEGIQHAFTTRHNGLGARIGGVKTRQDWDVVAKAFGLSPDRLVTVNQVHGEAIVVVDDRNFAGLATAQADALITKEPMIAIGVETADCVPILLIDPITPAVGAVHAGWRGTVQTIVRKAVAKMQSSFGSDPGQMIAAIGPAIGPECYEVDEPVMGPVRASFPFWNEVVAPRGNNRWSLDLVKLNRLELMQTGLMAENVHSLGLCTSCEKDLFYSFRAEGRTGRMLSAVMIKP